MEQYSGQSGVIARSALAVHRMLAEGHFADATSFLYCLHKHHIQEWVLVKRILLASATDSRSLMSVTTVLDASKKSTLSESARIIPGLADFFHEPPCQELLD